MTELVNLTRFGCLEHHAIKTHIIALMYRFGVKSL